MFVDYVDIVPFVKGFGVGIVEFVVENGSSPIFHCIFECCYRQNNEDGYSSKTRIWVSENGKYLDINNVLAYKLGRGRDTCNMTMNMK